MLLEKFIVVAPPPDPPDNALLEGCLKFGDLVACLLLAGPPIFLEEDRTLVVLEFFVCCEFCVFVDFFERRLARCALEECCDVSGLAASLSLDSIKVNWFCESGSNASLTVGGLKTSFHLPVYCCEW